MMRAALSTRRMNYARLLYAVKFIRTAAYTAVALVLASYLVQRGLSDSQVGVVFSAGIGGGLLGTLGLTSIIRRIGFKATSAVFSCMLALSGVLLLYGEGFLVYALAGFIGLLTVTQTEAGAFTALDHVLVSHWSGESERTGWFSWYNSVGYAGSATGALAVTLTGEFLPSAFAKSTLIGFYTLAGMAALFAYIVMPIKGEESFNTPHSIGQTVSRSPVVGTLALLFGVDAFGGGLVPYGWVSYWFQTAYHASQAQVGAMFVVSSIVSALSLSLATPLSRRFGLVKVMVFTHMPSNIILMAIPFAGSLYASTALFWVRQTLSQIDVPTRQSLVMTIVPPEQRAAAASVTVSSRNVAQMVSTSLTGRLFELAASADSFVLAGSIKVVYDLTLLRVMSRYTDVGKSAQMVREAAGKAGHEGAGAERRQAS